MAGTVWAGQSGASVYSARGTHDGSTKDPQGQACEVEAGGGAREEDGGTKCGGGAGDATLSSGWRRDQPRRTASRCFRERNLQLAAQHYLRRARLAHGGTPAGGEIAGG